MEKTPEASPRWHEHHAFPSTSTIGRVARRSFTTALSLRTGREPLGSSRSQYPAVGHKAKRLCLGHVAPPVAGWPPVLGGLPQSLRSSPITRPSSLLRAAPSPGSTL